jgi:DNA polymerase-3 subunit chi
MKTNKTTTVEFYLFEDPDPKAFILSVCHTLKNLPRRLKVYIQCEDEAHCFKLDESLWTFDAASFIPHQIEGEGPYPRANICLGSATDPPLEADWLMNLSTQLPGRAERYTHIIEYLANIESVRARARQRYQFYKQKGYAVTIQKIQSPAQLEAD